MYLCLRNCAVGVTNKIQTRKLDMGDNIVTRQGALKPDFPRFPDSANPRWFFSPPWRPLSSVQISLMIDIGFDPTYPY